MRENSRTVSVMVSEQCGKTLLSTLIFFFVSYDTFALRRWSDGSVWTGRWHDDTPMDPAAQSRAWDGFFHKNYEQQRAYVRELMQNSKDPHRQISSPS
jgi:hypothetical protein